MRESPIDEPCDFRSPKQTNGVQAVATEILSLLRTQCFFTVDELIGRDRRKTHVSENIRNVYNQRRLAKQRKNINAVELARHRWSKVPKDERAKQVPRSGGRPRKYPKCPRYGSHRFSPKTRRCPCGFFQPF